MPRWRSTDMFLSHRGRFCASGPATVSTDRGTALCKRVDGRVLDGIARIRCQALESLSSKSVIFI